MLINQENIIPIKKFNISHLSIHLFKTNESLIQNNIINSKVFSSNINYNEKSKILN